MRSACPLCENHVSPESTGSLTRRVTDLHFHGARLTNAYCIYLLASKVNLPAPVHESHAHIRARVSAGRCTYIYAHADIRARPRDPSVRIYNTDTTRASQRARLRPCREREPGHKHCRKFRARRLKGIHFSNVRDEREKPTRSSRPFPLSANLNNVFTM